MFKDVGRDCERGLKRTFGLWGEDDKRKGARSVRVSRQSRVVDAMEWGGGGQG